MTKDRIAAARVEALYKVARPAYFATLVNAGLLRNADAAMYRAKQLGRNNYRFYGR